MAEEAATDAPLDCLGMQCAAEAANTSPMAALLEIRYRARKTPRWFSEEWRTAGVAALTGVACGMPLITAGRIMKNIVEQTRYGLRVEIPVNYERAVEHATAALKAEGFGVLTTIDVQHTLKQKLDRDFRKYVILGACNPPLADRALHAELEIGLLLPCNVIVYEVSPGRSAVSAMAPMAALGIVGDNPELQAVAKEADTRLRRALAALEADVRS
jgi:uncharacterized protein (DUF302 family)